MFEVIGFHTWHIRIKGQDPTLCNRHIYNMNLIKDAEIPGDVECKQCLKAYDKICREKEF